MRWLRALDLWLTRRAMVAALALGVWGDWVAGRLAARLRRIAGDGS